MKPYEYSVFDPGGNVTGLITSPTPPAEQANLGGRLLGDESMRTLGVEQVGFVEQPNASTSLSLRMAGGELCLNAARCAE